MSRQQIFDAVCNLILAANTCLHPEDIADSASLTCHLGMDSFHLMTLFSNIKTEIADIEFTPWYAKVARHGEDSLGSLVDYITVMQGTARPRVAPVLGLARAVEAQAAVEVEQP